MAEISAKDVATLRKMTGAGMMDCKKALAESDGDMDRAKDWLREKGKAGAAKREGRAADQGAIDVHLEGNVGALVELNCETDFVAKGDTFKATVAALAKLVATEGADNVGDLAFEGSTVNEYLTQMSATMGEKIELGRCSRFVSDGGAIDAYKHIQSERGVLGVLVELSVGGDAAAATAHDVALHIASAAPRFTTRDEVPASEVEHERSVFEAQTKEEGKPEQAWPKIIEGKLNGFFKTVALVEQGFVKDPKQTIAAVVGALGNDAVVKRFVRVKIGEN